MDEKILPIGNISTVKHLGDLVRDKRKSANLTQFELSALSFVGTRFVSELENGKATLEIGKVLHVLQALGLTAFIGEQANQAQEKPLQKAGYKLLTPIHIEQFIQSQETVIPVFKKENTLFLPQYGADHSHILKLAPPQYKSLIANELFCTLLAKAAHLTVPEMTQLPQYDNTLLLEKSFQPNLPAHANKQMIERAIYNFLIGNFHHDASHSLVCTLVYPDFAANKASMNWEQFAKDKQIKLKLILEKIKVFKEKILSEMENVFEDIDKNFNVNIDVIPRICEMIEKRMMRN